MFLSNYDDQWFFTPVFFLKKKKSKFGREKNQVEEVKVYTNLKQNLGFFLLGVKKYFSVWQNAY